MTICTSCKNKTSNERCTSTALHGLTLCGRHAKVKSPRLWSVVNSIDNKIILISKVWRGYHIRNLIKLSGPGAIRRSICNNSEELVSMEPISNIDVFNYFGFEENGKIYAFDIRTIIECVNRQITPINPYTRQALSLDSRKRLRQLIAYRNRRKLENSYDPNGPITVQQMLRIKWLQICQICEENGFLNLPYELFIELNKTQLYVMLNMILNDMKTWAAEHKQGNSKRLIYASWIKYIVRKFSTIETSTEYSFMASSILLSILYDSVEPYNVCFIIMSSLYRL